MKEMLIAWIQRKIERDGLSIDCMDLEKILKEFNWMNPEERLIGMLTAWIQTF